MRKFVFTLVLAPLLMTPALALAGDNKHEAGGFQAGGAPSENARAVPGGFSGPGAPAVTVAEALKLGDDAWVTLTGRIEKQLGHEEYSFTDGTGAVRVEIDDKVWRGLTVGPEDVVVIQGEVDRDFTKMEIEVKSIAKK